MEQESNLNQAYALAADLAMDKLIGMDFESISINTNSKLSRDRTAIYTKYLNKDYAVFPGTRCIEYLTPTDGYPPIQITEKVLILHYLTTAEVCTPLSANLISFKEIAEGAIYYPSFHKRAIKPMIKVFSNNLEGFFKVGERLGGVREAYGDASFTLEVFPLVPVTYVIWQGDDEVEANGTILFDSSISNYLSVEDIVIAASFPVYSMMRLLR